jgi:hypothetical protein
MRWFQSWEVLVSSGGRVDPEIAANGTTRSVYSAIVLPNRMYGAAGSSLIPIIDDLPVFSR